MHKRDYVIFCSFFCVYNFYKFSLLSLQEKAVNTLTNAISRQFFKDHFSRNKLFINYFRPTLFSQISPYICIGNSLSYNVALLCPFDCCIKYYLFYGILVTCAYNHFLKWWPLGKNRKPPVEDAFFLWTSLLLTYILTNPT